MASFIINHFMITKKNLYFLWNLMILIPLFSSCSSSNNDEPYVVKPIIKNGISTDLEVADADKPLIITFKADQTSQLYNYTGDVYAHIGIVNEGTWEYVPAAWDQNIEKCKMVKSQDNIWSLTLSSSIRNWFNSGVTPVNKIGIVVRSQDGTKKGLTNEYFINVTDSKYKSFVPAAIKNAPLPTGVIEGINIVDNSTVTLVLYDKDKNGNHKDFAHVVGDFNNWTLANDSKSQMNRDENAGCWWITLTGLDSQKEYAFQYYLGTKDGNTVRLADAYSEKILDPDNDKYINDATYNQNKTYPEGAKGIASTFKINKESFTWSVNNFKINNPDKLVIYELNIRDFTTARNISAVTDKLSYLKSLGINAIELMPVQEFDGNNSWGYNPCFYFALDKAYGTKAMFRTFIDECHKQDIAVILDIVYNHATGNMPFAKLYWDSNNNLTAENNPYFNVTAPHPYSVFHDFNHDSPLVRKFFKRNLKFLIDEFKIDGFRFDLSKGLTQTASTTETAQNYDASRVNIISDYNSAIKAANPNAFVILEHFCDAKEESELASLKMHMWRNTNNAFCQSAMGYSENSSFEWLYQKDPYWVGYMESHDEERMAYKQKKWGATYIKNSLDVSMNQLCANTAFFLTVPGPKMIWEFGELGYDYSINSNESGTSESENYRTDPKPVKWDYLDVTSRKNLHDTYAKLLKLRNDYPELFSASAIVEMHVGVSDWNNGRSLVIKSTFGKEIVVVGNFTENSVNITFPSVSGEWYNYMKGVNENVPSTLSVPGNGYIVYTRL